MSFAEPIAECKHERIEAKDLANLTTDDKGTRVLTALAAKKVVKGRKEATATDLRQYAKQFNEAKLKKYQSWKDNNVFELVDTRKIKVKNFITGRCALTVKKNQMELSKRQKLDGFLEDF